MEKVRISPHVALGVRCPAGKRHFLAVISSGGGVVLFELEPVAVAYIMMAESGNELRVTKSICGHERWWR